MAMSHSKACAVAVSSKTVLLNREFANSATIASNGNLHTKSLSNWGTSQAMKRIQFSNLPCFRNQGAFCAILENGDTLVWGDQNTGELWNRETRGPCRVCAVQRSKRAFAANLCSDQMHRRNNDMGLPRQRRGDSPPPAQCSRCTIIKVRLHFTA